MTEFIGPDVANMTGTELADFGSKPGDMDSRFTGAASYALQDGTLPAGLTVNSTTGNIEGTPTESGSFPGITVRGSIAPAPVYGRWDAASIAFAQSVGGGLTADEYQINTVTDGTSTVKSDIGHVTGVHYFEIVCKGTIANAMVGMSDGSSHNGFPGSSAGSLAYWSKNGQIRESGGNIGGQPTIAQTITSVYGVIVDIDAETISWFVDGVAGTQDWSLNLILIEAGGISNLRPAVGNGSTTDTYEYRINAGQEAFAHPENIPDGCHLGWGIDVPVKSAPATNPVIQQNQWQDFAVGGTTGSLTYGVTPTAGNMLIAALTVDKDSGAITIPAGWTLVGTTEFGNTVSGALAYKISDGTEGAVVWSWTSSQASHVIWISEYSGVTELDVNAEANSADADVTSQTTGTTAANTVDGSLAVAIWGADTSNNVSTSQAYSNGFIQLHPFDPGALAGMSIATKILTGTAAVESTFSAVDSGDAMYGKVAVFK